ncbi:MAG: energy-coupling factor transporter ATPase [Firmicutes bacterium]|jgi:energy-coupling factor transport system ATP-binding protein|nr:energy-coupling factor transporter ATPase [Bacillota bacterium]MDD4335998.1 energy-coupling factor transporter ATPase [Bacillota bacterium]MDD4791542.1 energy-coupling factor transporter ATPase [Bacillota bacterium]
MKPVVHVENVSYAYDGGNQEQVEALLDVSLKIWPGEFVAVIGHNGSGKSTLAKHMNALLVPTRGNVYVFEMNTQDESWVWEIRQTVGMVFQNPDNQIVATTVEEDVAFGPENLGVEPGEIRRRVDEALALVDMTGYEKSAPHMLSGGQKQRVAIAGVIAMRPRCIVLDEPTAMLDPVGRTEVLRTVRRLASDEGISIVHITHFMNEAVYADRVIVMEEGRIALSGTPREVFSQPATLRKLDLDVPQVTELAGQLQAAGVALSRCPLTVEEMADDIGTLLGRGPCRSELHSH